MKNKLENTSSIPLLLQVLLQAKYRLDQKYECQTQVPTHQYQRVGFWAFKFKPLLGTNVKSYMNIYNDWTLGTFKPGEKQNLNYTQNSFMQPQSNPLTQRSDHFPLGLGLPLRQILLPFSFPDPSPFVTITRLEPKGINYVPHSPCRGLPILPH